VGHYVNGAVAKVKPSETALVRRPGYSCLSEQDWYDPGRADSAIEWVEKSWSAMLAFASQGTYLNFLSADGDAAVKATHGNNCPRLENRYDATNFSHLNRNFKLAETA
jgi:hypothetical protein